MILINRKVQLMLLESRRPNMARNSPKVRLHTSRKPLQIEYVDNAEEITHMQQDALP